MTQISKENLNFYTDRLKGLVGGEIVGVVASPPNPFGEVFVGMKIQKINGTRYVLWFLSDEEGNGPGAFDIEPERT